MKQHIISECEIRYETDECCREIAALRSMSCHNPQGTGVNELDGVE